MTNGIKIENKNSETGKIIYLKINKTLHTFIHFAEITLTDFQQALYVFFIQIRYHKRFFFREHRWRRVYGVQGETLAFDHVFG